MASPNNGNAASSPQPTSVHEIIPAPIATNEQRVCFICLQNDTDTPNATWVNPCPCSLEAHEECMLRWIAEMEASPRQSKKGGFKCPACKATITVEEPHDPLLAIRDLLYARYSRVSPYILTVIITGGSFAGALWYGQTAASIFAGRRAVARWMWPGERQRWPSTLIKLWILSSIGPGLVIMRWLPWLGTVVVLPFSVLYSATLVAQDDLPTWPPSPHWVVALMPLVQLSYSYLLYDLFGPLERRLNRALRGLPATEDDAALRNGAEQAGAAPAPAAGAAAARNEQEADGLWGAFANLGRAVLGLFADVRVEGEGNVDVELANEHFEIRIGAELADDQDEIDAGRDLEDEDEDGGRDGFQLPAEAAAQHEEQQQVQNPQEPADQRQPRPQAAQQNQNAQNAPDNQRNNDDVPEGSYFTLVINSIVTSLLFPAISYGMGELIRAVAPRTWVSPARSWGRKGPAGLLQQRWGRSLVGGCLFVVMRDAIALYTKYRRVQVRAKRRVRNVERRTESMSTGEAA
ncbi:hypothetical protein VTG60DRAFT_6362 [Thermothelomyces hinnuleus]